MLLADLIRHGKNAAAKQRNGNEDQQWAQQQHQQQQQQQAQPTQQQRRQARDHNRDHPRDGQQQQTHRTQDVKYRQELEQIVQEERQAKDKMPTYKGLENYRLLDKMGECVVHRSLPVLRANFASMSPSGAFSNVYRAIDLRTNVKVAGQHNVIVRPRYVLNATSIQSRSFASMNSVHHRSVSDHCPLTARIHRP